MADILQSTFSITFFWIKISEFWFISLKIFPKGSIDSNPALVQIMAWRWIFQAKPLSEPMIAYLLKQLYASLSLSELMNHMIIYP